jgi:hypothetical protein
MDGVNGLATSPCAGVFPGRKREERREKREERREKRRKKKENGTADERR